jgi:hypothetical protein
LILLCHSTLWPSQIIIIFPDKYIHLFYTFVMVVLTNTVLSLSREHTLSTSLPQTCLFCLIIRIAVSLLLSCTLFGSQFSYFLLSAKLYTLDMYLSLSMNCKTLMDSLLFLFIITFFCCILHNSCMEQVSEKVCWNWINFTNCVNHFSRWLSLQ